MDRHRLRSGSPPPQPSLPNDIPVSQWHHHLTLGQAKYIKVNLVPPYPIHLSSPLNSILRQIPNLTISLNLCCLHPNPRL